MERRARRSGRRFLIVVQFRARGEIDLIVAPFEIASVRIEHVGRIDVPLDNTSPRPAAAIYAGSFRPDCGDEPQPPVKLFPELSSACVLRVPI